MSTAVTDPRLKKEAPPKTPTNASPPTVPARQPTPKTTSMTPLIVAGVVGLLLCGVLVLVLGIGAFLYFRTGSSQPATATPSSLASDSPAAKKPGTPSGNLSLDYTVTNQWKDGETQHYDLIVSVGGNLEEGRKVALILVDRYEGTDLRAKIERKDLGNFKHSLSVSSQGKETLYYRIAIADCETAEILCEEVITTSQLQKKGKVS